MKKEVGSISQRYGSGDPDPDPHQNVTDPQHCPKPSPPHQPLTKPLPLINPALSKLQYTQRRRKRRKNNYKKERCA